MNNHPPRRVIAAFNVCRRPPERGTWSMFSRTEFGDLTFRWSISEPDYAEMLEPPECPRPKSG